MYYLKKTSVFYFLVTYVLLVVFDVDAYLIRQSEPHQLFNLATYVVLFGWTLWLFRQSLVAYVNQFVKNLMRSLFNVLMTFIGTVILSVLSSVVVSFLLMSIGLTSLTLENDLSINNLLTTFPLWLTFPIVAIIGPFVEELVFREFLQKSLQKYFSARASVIGQALTFALIHISSFSLTEVVNVLPHFLTGLLFGYTFHRTNNLFIPLTVHCLMNGLAILATLS